MLKPLSRWYLSKSRIFRYQGIAVKVLPGVFHPGFFFSTKVFLGFLESQPLSGKRVLELGAGSGLISLYCFKKGAQVTATDISKTALENIRINARLNNAEIEIIESDLLTDIKTDSIDIIIINPPYYPKPIKTEQDLAWFCGENFDYFEKLFGQLQEQHGTFRALMILSEDCDFNRIQLIAENNQCSLRQVYSASHLGERNFIYDIEFL